MYRAGLNGIRPKGITSWWGPLILDPNVAPNRTRDDELDLCPVDMREALETEQAIRRLPPDLMNVMWMEHATKYLPGLNFYVENGRVMQRPATQEQKATVLKISRRTYCYRCSESYTVLLGLMNDISAGL
jgi:hypothetical protein